MNVVEGIKGIFRRQCLKKYSSTVPTGIVPVSGLRSAVAFIDVEDTSFDECKGLLVNFFREHEIKGEIFFFDFRRLSEGERLITSIQTTILRKDLNWFGRPSKEKFGLMLKGEPDLFISLIKKEEFPIEFMAKCSRARFKIGRRQLPGNTFDLVVSDSKEKPVSQADLFRQILVYLDRIKA